MIHAEHYYYDCLHLLVRSRRYWEALVLLRIIVSVSDVDTCGHCFKCFFSELEQVVEKETSQVAHLAAGMEFLAYIRRGNVRIPITFQPMVRYCIKNTYKLFEYFFESNNPSDWYGLLADEWKRCRTALHGRKGLSPLTKTQATTALSKVSLNTLIRDYPHLWH